MKRGVTSRLARHLSRLRAARGWTLDQLSAQSGVSRAALSRLENAEASPSLDVLARLANAHGMALSRLLAALEEGGARHVRRDEQPVFLDEAARVTRRVVSPGGADLSAEMVEITVPPGTEFTEQNAQSPGQEHHLVMLSGYMTVILENAPQALGPGDALRYRLYGPARFVTEKGQGARYLLCTVGA